MKCDPGRMKCDPGRMKCDPGRMKCDPGRMKCDPGRMNATLKHLTKQMFNGSSILHAMLAVAAAAL
jgi:hypothetical protein